MERAEILIVGAGLAGASAAWWLAGDARVLVIEQGAAAGAEASAQNAGMQRRLVADPAERALACRSAEILGELIRGRWADNPCFRRTGAVVANVGETDRLTEAAADLVARGVVVESVAGQELGRIAPALRGAALHHAWFLPDEGLLDPHGLLTAMLREAREHGARMALERRALRLLVENGVAVGVQTAEGAIYADKVVIANGAWAQQMAASAGLSRPLRPLARHLLMSDEHPLSRPDHPWCWLDDVGLYLRPEAGGWLISPCDERELTPPDGPGSRGAVDPEIRALAADKLARYLPAVAGLRLAGGWTGLRTFTPERRAMIGADPDVSGLFWAVGLGGGGVSAALAIGERVRQAVVGTGSGILIPYS